MCGEKEALPGSGRIWFISDTHFCHKNILAYEDRPFTDIESMNSALITRWNEVVQPEDTVYHLGDVALGPSERFHPIIGALNGHKILIRGNHDMKSREWYLERGFEEVYPALMLYAKGKRILLTHRPTDALGESYDLHFYGHVHNKMHHGEYEGMYPTVARNGACLCVERWNYYPVPLELVLERCHNAPTTCPNI